MPQLQSPGYGVQVDPQQQALARAISSFNTPLSTSEEQAFQRWKGIYAPNDPGHDYDLRGAYKAGLKPGTDQHWLDTFKKPNHPTFSDESIYSSLAGTKPGHWEGQTFIPFSTGTTSDKTLPPWGFHEPGITAGAGVEAGLNKAGDVLSDPRNAWMGLGPLGAMSRFRRVPNFGRDMGGFNVPTSQMMKQDTSMARLSELPEYDRRADYMFGRKLENTMADTMQQGPYGKNALPYLEAQDRYAGLSSLDKENVNKVLLGRQALEQEILQQSLAGGGGQVPSDLMLRRFGFYKK